jgi:hypothetical protein
MISYSKSYILSVEIMISRRKVATDHDFYKRDRKSVKNGSDNSNHTSQSYAIPSSNL